MRTCQLRPKSQIKREPTNEFKGGKTAYENLQTSIENIGGCSGVRVHSCRGGQSYSQQAQILHVRMSRRRQRLWPRHWCAWHQPGGYQSSAPALAATNFGPCRAYRWPAECGGSLSLAHSSVPRRWLPKLFQPARPSPGVLASTSSAGGRTLVAHKRRFR